MTRCAGVRIPDGAAEARARISLEARSLTGPSSANPRPASEASSGRRGFLLDVLRRRLLAWTGEVEREGRRASRNRSQCYFPGTE